jgi:hypothetical protein
VKGTIARLKEQARRLGEAYPHLLECDYDSMLAGDEDQEPVAEKQPKPQSAAYDWLRATSTEIRNGAAHKRVEAEMLDNFKR